MVRVHWDSEDARFTYFNNRYFSSADAAIDSIKHVCALNEEQLRLLFKAIDYIEDGNEAYDTNFEAWIDWCIDEFLYLEEIEIIR